MCHGGQWELSSLFFKGNMHSKVLVGRSEASQGWYLWGHCKMLASCTQAGGANWPVHRAGSQPRDSGSPELLSGKCCYVVATVDWKVRERMKFSWLQLPRRLLVRRNKPSHCWEKNSSFPRSLPFHLLSPSHKQNYAPSRSGVRNKGITTTKT